MPEVQGKGGAVMNIDQLRSLYDVLEAVRPGTGNLDSILIDADNYMDRDMVRTVLVTFESELQGKLQEAIRLCNDIQADIEEVQAEIKKMNGP
jgi:hypothetical protein